MLYSRLLIFSLSIFYEAAHKSLFPKFHQYYFTTQTLCLTCILYLLSILSTVTTRRRVVLLGREQGASSFPRDGNSSVWSDCNRPSPLPAEGYHGEVFLSNCSRHYCPHIHVFHSPVRHGKVLEKTTKTTKLDICVATKLFQFEWLHLMFQ